jgi:hypothetical protein
MNITTDWLQDVEPTVILRSPEGKLRLFRKVSINDYFTIQDALKNGWIYDTELSAQSAEDGDNGQ